MPVYVLDAVTKQISRSYLRSTRVALVTDASDTTALPPDCLDIADEVHFGSLHAWQSSPQTADAVVAVFKGESLTGGSFRSLRHLLLEPARQYYVPVHHPGVPALDLIAIEPRWGRRNPAEEVTSSQWRIASSNDPSATVLAFLDQQQSAWARLSLALWAARDDLGQGINRLSALLGDSIPPWLQALVLRNLIILLWRSGRLQDGNTLVDRALQMFPTCPEFLFMAAVREWSAHKPVETLRFAQQAIETEKSQGRGAWVGSGGEGSYRAHALIATVAEHLGDHKSAFYNFLPGLRRVPPFPDSVHGILRQEVPPRVMDWLQLELRNAARMHPEYRPAVIAFLRKHQCRHAAALLDRLQAGSPAPLMPTNGEHGKPAADGIAFAGPLFAPGQDSRILRTLARAYPKQKVATATNFRVINEEFTLRSLCSTREQFPTSAPEETAPPRVTLCIHEQPHFDRPDNGRLAILMLHPFNALPQSWAGAIHRNVDALLVPSAHSRKTLLRAGIPQAKIHDLPPLVDSSLYTVAGERFDLSSGNTVFLFPAPCSYLYGIDLLLNAWDRAFTSTDRATLVIWHDGPGVTIPDGTLKRIGARVAQTSGAPVRWIDGPLSDERRAGLLRGADIAVLPFRMEATAQTALESVACGTPVIASGIEPFKEVHHILGDAALLIDGAIQPLPLAEESREVWSELPVGLDVPEDALAQALRQALSEKDRLRAVAAQTSPIIQRAYGEPSATALNHLLSALDLEPFR